MKWFNSLLFAFICLTLAACSPTVNHEVGQLSLNYDIEQGPRDGLSLPLAIVSPVIGGISSSYSEDLITAFDNSFQQLLTAKGFNVIGPYRSFDDMTYGEKQKGYLAIIPVTTMKMQKKVVHQGTDWLTGIYTQKGHYYLEGEVKIDFIEPLTKEKVMTKRINLRDFNIKKEYTYQIKNGKGFTFIGDMLSATKTINDDQDKATVDAINEFFTKSMTKIEKFISTEEILSYNGQVDSLKNMKRF